MQLVDGLTHRYEFEEDGGGLYLDSVGSDDLVILGVQVPTVGGKLSRAGTFETTQTYARLGADNGMFAADAFSVTNWFWIPTTHASTERQWMTASGTVAHTRMSIGPTNIPFCQQFNASETLSVIPSTAFIQPFEAWVHTAYTFERGVGTRLYVNGVLAASATQTVDEASPAAGGTPIFTVHGRDNTGASGPGDGLLEGRQDQLWIWDRAITATEVLQHFNGGFGVTVGDLPVITGGVSAGLIELTAAADQFVDSLVPLSVKFISEGATVAGDLAILVDPVTGDTLWSDVLSGPGDSKLEEFVNLRTWPNGARLGTLTGDRGTVAIRY